MEIIEGGAMEEARHS